MFFKSILFSDYDFTLCEHGNPDVFFDNLKAIEKWRKAENYFAIATGRGEESLLSAWPDCHQYCNFLILCDGSIIKDRHGKLVYADRFGADLANRLSTALLSANFISDYAFICFNDTKESPTIEASTCKIRLWFNDLADYAVAEKILTTKFADDITAIAYRDVAFNDDHARLPWVSASMSHIIEVTRSDTDKSTGIKRLLDTIGVHDPKRIITIGDDKNDITMIKSFDGYVVENGNPEVLKHLPTHRRVPHLHNLITNKLSS
jgi:HAD superfamily hydrolase (TIGR01484 family)